MDSKSMARATELVKKKRRMSARKTVLICVTVVALIVLFGLLVNSLLSVANPGYYVSLGSYRLFSVVDDHLEPEIPINSMIAAKRPTIPEAIKPESDGGDGSIIVFKLRQGDKTVISMGRVVSVNNEGDRTEYSVSLSRDGKATVMCAFSDVVGVYCQKKVGFFGGFFAFFGSVFGVIILIALIFIILLAWWLWRYINRLTVRRKLERAALEKSAQALSNVGLRYDNIHEITAVMDVLSMLTETPRTKKESAEIASRLNAFIKAENITLPQTPETAAILDSLPAPDTPGSLAAALASGATLRQAEDGQTLVLTTISGGKNILLTPVQTADGIILCQQGMRVKSDLAPNIEDIGFTSMPASPEFFEGQPLEKNVEYPELPQPSRLFGPEQIGRGETSEPAQIGSPEMRLSAPKPVGNAGYALLTAPEHVLPQDAIDPPRMQTIGAASQSETRHVHSSPAEEQRNTSVPYVDDRSNSGLPEQSDLVASARDAAAFDNAVENPINSPERSAHEEAYLKYRGRSAEDELLLAEELHALLNEVSPLTAEEQRKVEEYKSSRKKQSKSGGKSKKPADNGDTDNTAKKQAARQAAARKKAEHEAFLNSLSPEAREVYLAEQKLKKSREAAVRKLKKIAADRKLLQKIDKD